MVAVRTRAQEFEELLRGDVVVDRDRATSALSRGRIGPPDPGARPRTAAVRVEVETSSERWEDGVNGGHPVEDSTRQSAGAKRSPWMQQLECVGHAGAAAGQWRGAEISASPAVFSAARSSVRNHQRRASCAPRLRLLRPDQFPDHDSVPPVRQDRELSLSTGVMATFYFVRDGCSAVRYKVGIRAGGVLTGCCLGIHRVRAWHPYGGKTHRRISSSSRSATASSRRWATVAGPRSGF